MDPRGISSLGHLAGTASVATACRANDVATSTDKPGDVAAAAGVARLVSAATIDLATRMNAADRVCRVVGSDQTTPHE